jgi:hypothetical protein
MSVIDAAVSRAVQILAATGVEYEVRMPDGKVYGGLKQPEQASKRGKRILKRPYGSGKAVFDKHLGPLQIGEVVTIKVQEGFSIKELQSGATAWANARWGKGSYVSSRTADDSGVEILRVL